MPKLSEHFADFCSLMFQHGAIQNWQLQQLSGKKYRRKSVKQNKHVKSTLPYSPRMNMPISRKAYTFSVGAPYDLCSVFLKWHHSTRIQSLAKSLTSRVEKASGYWQKKHFRLFKLLNYSSFNSAWHTIQNYLFFPCILNKDFFLVDINF